MKIDIAVHGRFHAFELARGLHDRGLLGTLHTTYPGFAVRRIVGEGVATKCAPYLETVRRLAQRSPWQDATDYILPRFGRFVARSIGHSEADVLIGWSSAILEAIPVARTRGMAVVIDRGASHIEHQQEVLATAYGADGIDFPGISKRVIARETAEYEAADRIMVLSSIAARSFVDRGVPPEKLVVVPLGVDSGRFRPVDRSGRSGRPKILFVGAIGVQKGTPHLLRSFAPLSRQAELHLVGPVEPGFDDFLKSLPTEGVTFRGAVPKEIVPQLYAEADVFCLPSVQEGFGMVVLEAMASGLPAVVSDQVGAADVITQGESGYVFPLSEGEALKDILAELIREPGPRLEIGRAARTVAESRENSWDGYVDRVVPVLQELAR